MAEAEGQSDPVDAAGADEVTPAADAATEQQVASPAAGETGEVAQELSAEAEAAAPAADAPTTPAAAAAPDATDGEGVADAGEGVADASATDAAPAPANVEGGLESPEGAPVTAGPDETLRVAEAAADDGAEGADGEGEGEGEGGGAGGEGGADAADGEAEAEGADAPDGASVQADATIQQIDIPGTEIAITGGEAPAPSSVDPAAAAGLAPARACAQRIGAAVDAAVADFQDGLQDVPQSELHQALYDWSAKLQDHMSGLSGILEAAEARARTPVMMGTGELAADMENVRHLRHQLEAQRTGSEVEQVASAWADPEETAKEVSELRRVRRQIRCIFGGMLSNLPDSSGALRVDELLSDREEELAAMSMGVKQSPRAADASAQLLPPEGFEDPAKPADARDREDRHAHAHAPPRPRSGATEMSVSATSSGTGASFAAREKEKKEKKERKHRRERERERDHRDRERERERDRDRERRERDPSPAIDPLRGSGRDEKRDDGAPPRQWSWAEEVVKASLDPQNQWEFPDSASTAALARKQQPSWEQPRQGVPQSPGQRGTAIASKARERAEEIMRAERLRADRM